MEPIRFMGIENHFGNIPYNENEYYYKKHENTASTASNQPRLSDYNRIKLLGWHKGSRTVLPSLGGE